MSILNPPNTDEIYVDAEIILGMEKCELDSLCPKLCSQKHRDVFSYLRNTDDKFQLCTRVWGDRQITTPWKCGQK